MTITSRQHYDQLITISRRSFEVWASSRKMNLARNAAQPEEYAFPVASNSWHAWLECSGLTEVYEMVNDWHTTT